MKIEKVGLIKCSFCGRSEADGATKLIAGPDVYICNECIEMCIKILKEKGIDYEQNK